MKQSVCVILRNKEGQHLMVSRKTDHSDFTLPGGKVDPGELIEAAAIREIKEETGLDISNLKLVNIDDCNGYEQHTFTADYSGNDQFDGVTVFDPIHENHIVKWGCIEQLNASPTFGSYNQNLFNKLNLR